MLTRFSMAVMARRERRGLASVMRARPRAFPHLWLTTDSERQSPDDVIAAVSRLPHGAGVVLRHRDPQQRRALARSIWPICRARRLVMVVAGDWRLAAALRCDGVHAPDALVRAGLPSGLRLWVNLRRGILSAAAHDAPALHRAERSGATLTMVSAVLPTASHPDRRPLGRVKFASLSRAGRGAVIALGGIGPATLTQLNGIRCWGVAGVGFAA